MSAAANDSPPKKPSILVVDDNADMVELLRLKLTGAGYAVITAEHPLRALDLLEQQMPDVMVLDIMMPVRSGIEVLENIRWNPRYAQLPIIVLSAATLREEDRAFVNEFSRAYLDKTDLDKLVPLIQEILKERDT